MSRAVDSPIAKTKDAAAQNEIRSPMLTQSRDQNQMR
jgi:hypothetical protein